MGLNLPTNYKGIDLPNAYYKITGISYTEKGTDEQGKIYNLVIQLNSYTDSTKEFDIEQRVFNFDARLDGLTIEDGYVLLKSLLEFSSAIDN